MHATLLISDLHEASAQVASSCLEVLALSPVASDLEFVDLDWFSRSCLEAPKVFTRTVLRGLDLRGLICCMSLLELRTAVCTVPVGFVDQVLRDI